MDPIQTLKTQIGDLVWMNALLSAELDKVGKERDLLKKEKEDGSASSEPATLE